MTGRSTHFHLNIFKPAIFIHFHAADNEAMGERVKAAEYYRKSAEFAATNEGFDQEVVDMYREDAERMESGEYS